MRPFPFAVMMIRPAKFEYNAQTAVNNAFQVADDNQSAVSEKAIAEFDAFVNELKAHDVEILVVQDTLEPHTPDSIFPNNWISTHKDNSIVYYPMFAENRRQERKQTVINALKAKYKVVSESSYVDYESKNTFLEGTGSMVLDRKKRIAYACISPRTDKELFIQWCKDKDYEPVYFEAIDSSSQQIYHTNVMMCVCDNYAVICLDSIANTEEKEYVINKLKRSNKTIIPITMEQMNQFAGNMLQVKNRDGVRYLVMSTTAYNSLTQEQISIIKSFTDIIHSDIATIEQNGGGSARCMLAEIVLDKI